MSVTLSKYIFLCAYVCLPILMLSLFVCFSGTPEVVVCASYCAFQPHTDSFRFGQMVRLILIPPLFLAVPTIAHSKHVLYFTHAKN